MSDALSPLLAKLRAQAIDHKLDAMVIDVDSALAERAAINGQTWQLRAAAAAILLTGGAFISASSATAVAASSSPFEVWSKLAPSTLLDPSK